MASIGVSRTDEEVIVRDRSNQFREFLIKIGDDLACPICSETERRRPNIAIFTSSCGHDLCDACFDREFMQAGTIKCPFTTRGVRCGEMLMKKDFRRKEFTNGEVHRELLIREEVNKFYSFSLKDFNCNEELYNRELEKVEGLVFNLVNRVNLKETHDELDRHKAQRKREIEAQQQTSRRERIERHHKLKLEQELVEKRRAENDHIRAGERREMKLKRAQLVHALLNCSKEDVPKYMKQLQDLKAGAKSKPKEPVMQDPVPEEPKERQEVPDVEMLEDQPEGMDYEYHPAEFMVQSYGPTFPITPMLQTQVVRHLNLNVLPKELTSSAAGFVAAHVAKRAIQDAYSCLFVT